MKALILHSSDANVGINSNRLNGSFSDFEMQIVGEGSLGTSAWYFLLV